MPKNALKNSNNQTIAFICLITGLSFMCFAAILVRLADAPGMVTTLYRMSIGALTLLPFFTYRLFSRKTILQKKGVLLAILGGICFGNDMAIWSTGVSISNATIPTVFANTAPIWVGIGSIIIFKEKHKWSFWAGLIISVIGTLLMVKEDLNMDNGILKGALMGLLAGLFYGLFYLIAQSGRKLMDTISFLFISSATSALTILIYVLIFKHPLTGYSKETYLIFLAFGIGIQVIGWYFINYSQGFLPASIVAPTLLGQPVLTALLATFILNEHLSFWHIVGGSIVILGIYIVYFSRKP